MASRPVRAQPANQMARARERFLAVGSAHPLPVREPILASWWRSREWNVPADRTLVPYVGDPDPDTALTRRAAPVLRQLRENLDGQPVSVILADAAGVVLSRLTADDDLERHLDEVMLAPGFSYAEASVGTNGLGTALEGGQPAQVFGPEHYARLLADIASAGIPIHHPISGRLAGVVGLTCWRHYTDQDAAPLLMALVKTAADQITQALLTESTAQELELLQDYLRACRRGSGIVLALNDDVVMMNDHARHALEPADTEVLLVSASEALAGGRTSAVNVDLPTGLTARLHCRPAGSASPRGTAGGVVQVKLVIPARSAGDAPAPGRMFLPALVGSGALWLRSSERVRESCEKGEWLALEGEPGVGKLALARAVHQRLNPALRFNVFDAADVGGQDWLASVRRALLHGEGDLVIRHVDQLGPQQAHALAAVLAQARPAGITDQTAGRGARRHSAQAPGEAAALTWVAITQTHGNAALTELLRLFPTTVPVPPLRHHIKDLPELARFFLGRLSHQSRLTWSPEALKLLMRSSWPGNAEQLWQVTRRIVQRRRVGAIRPRDLPPECWTVSRRLLSPLETLERDAIVEGLLGTEGNKARAAESLGMSRASIYRKVHEYGIIVPVS
jgi:sigma-54 dependent transcriptional regulator, acetoin dehydrogenase operon transcriptional activator AcoR